ncbi:DUF3307 domain-containing protein [Thalassococcus sp. S3]|uniref:DUF3307 domain-containing protein n=1 Tax=Thalassococcus sp. S3 TaxID=2017482 RepID=UPI0010246483|nr:DUF3307 domain-containing protein [Thalassococcus sp. S3]QBF30701.1 hypothetical protein CFI11_05650 [Thalassococcus sp. S3]
MTDAIKAVLILLCLLQFKHMFADYFLQTPKMLAGRATYFHMGRAQHAGVHAVGSALALVIVGTSLPLLLFLIVAEWIVHFHIDWGKASYSDAKAYTPAQAGFWRAAGFDQALHQLTYIAMVWAWVEWP